MPWIPVFFRLRKFKRVFSFSCWFFFNAFKIRVLKGYKYDKLIISRARGCVVYEDGVVYMSLWPANCTFQKNTTSNMWKRSYHLVLHQSGWWVSLLWRFSFKFGHNFVTFFQALANGSCRLQVSKSFQRDLSLNKTVIGLWQNKAFYGWLDISIAMDKITL